MVTLNKLSKLIKTPVRKISPRINSASSLENTKLSL